MPLLALSMLLTAINQNRTDLALCRQNPTYKLQSCFRAWVREELNLQCLPLGNWFTVSRNTANRCRFPKTALRRLAIIFFVPCVALGIQNADYSQTIERLQANSIIWPLRQARIRTLHYWFQKRCGCWLRMIARLPLGNTLTDRFLYLQYPFCHCLTIWGNYIFDSSGTVG